MLAFARRIDPSDACMYRTKWNERDLLEPLELKTKTIRTVLSNRIKDKKDEAEEGKALKGPDEGAWQIHRGQYCTLGPDFDTLAVRFTLKFLGGLKPYACNDSAYCKDLEDKIRSYMEASDQAHGIGDLGLRYARNIAAAGFLWRNRIGAEAIETEVRDISAAKGGQSFVFDSLSIPFDFYEDIEPDCDLALLGRLISDTLKDPSEGRYLLLEVTARVKLGCGREVYPSQQMVENGSKSDLSRLLHSVDGIAAITSQKVGNAIRRIDTWYEQFEEVDVPISVETYGTYTSFGEVFRPKGPYCFYSLFDKWMAGEEITGDDRNYVIAMLIRGGVFGDKEE